VTVNAAPFPVTPRCQRASMAEPQGVEARGWSEGDVLSFDLETTGVDPDLDVPVSYALVRAREGRLVEVECSLVDPGRRIPAEATAVHGITTLRAQHEGVPLGTAVTALGEHLVEASRSGVPVVGMNVSFALTMLDACYRRQTGRHLVHDGFEGPVVDVLVLDRHFDRYRPGRRTLADLCRVYGVATGRAHDARDDAVATLAVVTEMCRRFPPLRGADVLELHHLQVQWHRQWSVSFSAWRRRQGLAELVDLPRSWPIGTAGGACQALSSGRSALLAVPVGGVAPTG